MIDWLSAASITFGVLGLLFLLAAILTACVDRIAPFSPHRTNTQDHRMAKTNSVCIECHNIAEVGHNHTAKDDCMRCHRIVQGD